MSPRPWRPTVTPEERIAQLEQQIKDLAGLSPSEARAQVLREAEAELQDTIIRQRDHARAEAQDQARHLVLTAMERLAGSVPAPVTTSVVPLPNPDLKAKLVGREGRNIRAFAQTTGVDMIIDQGLESVTLACFDPVRREVARLTLLNLIVDGRIHPQRIQELHAEAQATLSTSLKEAGEEAARRAGITGLPAPVIEALGQLRVRTSYGQNVLDHSVEVARLARLLAEELQLDPEPAATAGLLHDIGKGFASDNPRSHAQDGMKFLQGHGLDPQVCEAVGAHHREIPSELPLTALLIAADAISAGRPGARREPTALFQDRLEELEKVAKGFRGVDHAFAIQAGRELRVMVRAEDMSDEDTARLATQIARALKQKREANAPPLTLTVVRERIFQESIH